MYIYCKWRRVHVGTGQSCTQRLFGTLLYVVRFQHSLIHLWQPCHTISVNMHRVKTGMHLQAVQNALSMSYFFVVGANESATKTHFGNGAAL